MSDSQRKPRYILRPVVTPVAGAQPTKSAASKSEASSDPFLRPAQEDDDGYDPVSYTHLALASFFSVFL